MTYRSYQEHNYFYNASQNFVPIRREDYAMLIEDSSTQSTPLRSRQQMDLLFTPQRSTRRSESFNSSAFLSSNYRSPGSVCSTIVKRVSSNFKPKRLMKHALIPQKECSICLQSIKEQADLLCSHSYCLPCLQQWLKNATKCPYCRSDVSSYNFKGKTFKVQPKQFQYKPSNAQIMDWICYRCDHTEEGDVVMICDRCGAFACHIQCDPALNGVEPQGEWYCHYCR